MVSITGKFKVVNEVKNVFIIIFAGVVVVFWTLQKPIYTKRRPNMCKPEVIYDIRLNFLNHTIDQFDQLNYETEKPSKQIYHL